MRVVSRWEAHKNTASVAILTLLDALRAKGDARADAGFDIRIKKMMPLGSGLGSSAASSVAAVVGANALLGEPFTPRRTPALRHAVGEDCLRRGPCR